MTDAPIIAHFVAYTDEADLEIGDDGEVLNHDDLVADGYTYEEVRALADTEANRQYLADHMILDESDSMWRESFAEMDVGDAIAITDPAHGTPAVA